MAIQKKVLYNGAEINYWKISGINVTWTGKIAQIFIIGFLSEEDRNISIENKVIMENYMCKKEKFDEYFGVNSLDAHNPLKASYNFLKSELDIFVESIDV
ncbi:MAG TPA: hypothetical protein DDZ33_05070 [Clostridium sp.]|nr:hypothetical protein [Clostridium sp.]